MLEERLVNILKENNLTISTVESCTGGDLINRITNIEGASDVSNGGIVTYSNSQKIKVGVSKRLISKYGVYSIECAEAMAEVGLDFFSSDICIGVTGTLTNLDTNNIDSKQGKVFYSIKIRINSKLDKLNYSLEVPIKDRKLQKEYISSIIIEKLIEFLENLY